MSIDPKTLPEGTVIGWKWRDGSRDERIGFVEKCIAAGCFDNPLGDVADVSRVFVPVPDGMTVEDAQQALTEHVAWVPLPDGPTEAHVGARVRQEYAHGGGRCRREGELKSLPFPGAADVAGWKELRTVDADWFVHPDDVPGPDSAVLDALARLLADEAGFTWPAGVLAQRVWVQRARAALAVVREHEAGQ